MIENIYKYEFHNPVLVAIHLEVSTSTRSAGESIASDAKIIKNYMNHNLSHWIEGCRYVAVILMKL